MQTERGTGNAHSTHATVPGKDAPADALPLDDLSQLATANPKLAAQTPDAALLLTRGPLDTLLAQYDEACSNEAQTSLDAFFAQAMATATLDSPSARQALLIELIALDLEHRWKRQVATLREFATLATDQPDGARSASSPRLNDYRPLWEKHFGLLKDWPLKLILCEFRVRRTFGDLPTVEEYLEQFPDVPGLPDRLRRLVEELNREPGSNGEPAAPWTLQADYELRREIARGGMGIVYEAWQRSLRRTVAVKMILSGQLASPEAVRRFRAEAQAAARLSHPHIVPVYEVGQDGGQHFFAMGYVDGESLSARVARQGPLEPQEAATLLVPIAEAVQYAHQQGVVHRDLKPQNVLLTKDGRPMVSDFGLAKHVDEVGLTLAGQVVGTPAFMSPEQAQGRLAEIGPVSDVYSLGAVLYYLLTGRPPFHTASMPETLRQVIDLEPAPPRSLNPEVSRDLETICLKCLEKDAAKRYPSAQALADDLRRYCNGDEIVARPISPLERSWRWCRRRPASAALAVLIFLVFAIGGPALAWFRAELATAEKEAEASRKVAASQTYFVTVGKAADRIDGARRGWTRDGLSLLKEAADMDTPLRDLPLLRSQAARCLLGTDLDKPREAATKLQGACLAFSADGDWLAVGEYKAQAMVYCRVHVIDTQTLATVHELWFTPRPLFVGLSPVQDGCRKVAFSPDRRWLAIGARSGNVHVWDLKQTPPAHHAFRAHDTEIENLLFSPDGKFAYTSGQGDKSLKAWSVDPQWRQAGTHTADGPIDLLSVHLPEGGLIVDSGEQPPNWVSFDLQSTRRLTLPRVADTIGGPWKNAYLMASQRRLELYASPLEVVAEYSDPATVGRTFSNFPRAEFSRDGRLLMAVTSSDRKVSLWDAVSGTMVATSVFEPDVLLAAALSPDGRRLAMLARRRVLLFDVLPPLSPSVVIDRPQPPELIAWLPELPAAAKSVDHTVGFLATPAGTIAVGFEAFAFAAHPSSRRLAMTYGRDWVRVWDLAKPEPAEVVRLKLLYSFDLAFSVDGQTLYGISNGVDVWSWTVGQTTHKVLFTNRLADMLTGRSTLISIAVGGKHILLGSREGELLHLPIESAVPQRWPLGIGPIGSVALSQDEKLAACGAEDGQIRLVALPSGRVESLARHEDHVSSIEFSPDGTLLASASLDRTVRLWQQQNGHWAHLLTLRFPSGVLGAHFHPHRATLAIQVKGELALRVLSLEALRAALDANNLGW